MAFHPECARSEAWAEAPPIDDAFGCCRDLPWESTVSDDGNVLDAVGQFPRHIGVGGAELDRSALPCPVRRASPGRTPLVVAPLLSLVLLMIVCGPSADARMEPPQRDESAVWGGGPEEPPDVLPPIVGRPPSGQSDASDDRGICGASIRSGGQAGTASPAEPCGRGRPSAGWNQRWRSIWRAIRALGR